MRWIGIIFVLLGATAPAPAEQSTVDWLLEQATTAPTTRPDEPTTRPTDPLQNAAVPAGIEGRVTLSDGTVLTGLLTTTPQTPIRVWSEDEKEYRDLPLSAIASLQAKILWERQQPQWHFIDSGSDIKEYTGKSYPARELLYDLVLRDGQALTGGVVAPLYVQLDGHKRQLVLHKRAKGDVGQSLEQLVYVLRVELGDAKPAN